MEVTVITCCMICKILWLYGPALETVSTDVTTQYSFTPGRACTIRADRFVLFPCVFVEESGSQYLSVVNEKIFSD